MPSLACTLLFFSNPPILRSNSVIAVKTQMFLPTTFLKLHAAIGSNVRKVPLEVFVKPDQIFAMCVVNAKAGRDDDPEAKDVELTKLVIPFADPVYVQEPPQMICEMIATAFNRDVDKLMQAQQGLVVPTAGGGAIRPSKLG